MALAPSSAFNSTSVRHFASGEPLTALEASTASPPLFDAKTVLPDLWIFFDRFGPAVSGYNYNRINFYANVNGTYKVVKTKGISLRDPVNDSSLEQNASDYNLNPYAKMRYVCLKVVLVTATFDKIGTAAFTKTGFVQVKKNSLRKFLGPEDGKDLDRAILEGKDAVHALILNHLEKVAAFNDKIKDLIDAGNKINPQFHETRSPANVSDKVFTVSPCPINFYNRSLAAISCYIEGSAAILESPLFEGKELFTKITPILDAFLKIWSALRIKIHNDDQAPKTAYVFISLQEAILFEICKNKNVFDSWLKDYRIRIHLENIEKARIVKKRCIDILSRINEPMFAGFLKFFREAEKYHEEHPGIGHLAKQHEIIYQTLLENVERVLKNIEQRSTSELVGWATLLCAHLPSKKSHEFYFRGAKHLILAAKQSGKFSLYGIEIPLAKFFDSLVVNVKTHASSESS